jgi:glycosyltransferase involved in cell wall biosynthesis
MSGQKSILLVTNSITGGGAEISMGRLFQSLRSRKVDVRLCAINQDLLGSPLLDGMTVLGRGWGSSLLGTYKSLLNFRKMLRHDQSSIIIVNCELPELYVALVCPISKIVISVEHTSRPWKGRKLLGMVTRLILNLRQTRWVTVSSDQKRIWPFGNSALFIPNPYLSSTRNKITYTSDLVYVGRLNSSKHPEIAAKAAREAGARVIFYGDGPMIEDLRKDFESKNCVFAGFVNDPWSSISKESVLVVTSDYEGDGMSIVEAVLNGNPILLADNIDLRRFKFPDQVYFKDLSNLVEKIKLIKDSSSENFKITGELLERLRDQRNLSKVTDQWVSLVNEIV